ncbi:MAG TPA: isopentenyl-diphosphate Delta-isomerase [Wenzhouxiangella sp.]
MNHAVVSSEDEALILVNAEDEAIGSLSKGACHDGEGVLHRAFSVFLFDHNNRLLVQQRAQAKRLWPLYWANSCCSHPRVGEDMATATLRRIKEELGVESHLEYVYKFQYHARFGDLGSEHELCSVYLGRVEAVCVKPNPTEIANTRWLDLSEVDAWMAEHEPVDAIAPWFRMEWSELRTGEQSALLEFLKN